MTYTVEKSFLFKIRKVLSLFYLFTDNLAILDIYKVRYRLRLATTYDVIL